MLFFLFFCFLLTNSLWAQSLEFTAVSAIWFHKVHKIVTSPIALEDRNAIILEDGILVSSCGPTQMLVRFGNLTYLKCNILNLELIDREKYKQLLTHPEVSIEPFDTLWKNNALLNVPLLFFFFFPFDF